MKKITVALAVLLFVVPSVSFAAALTTQQSNSLIAVVQSSPNTPASAFVSLITSFSNITVNQATSLITVVQSAPSAPASAFVNLLISFTVDTPTTQSTIQPIPTTASTSSDTSTSSKPTVNVTVNPSNVPYGGSATISWIATGALSCTLDSSPVLLASTGSQLVNPTDPKADWTNENSTTYRTTCTNAGSSASRSITVTVQPWIPPTGYKALPPGQCTIYTAPCSEPNGWGCSKEDGRTSCANP